MKQRNDVFDGNNRLSSEKRGVGDFFVCVEWFGSAKRRYAGKQGEQADWRDMVRPLHGIHSLRTVCATIGYWLGGRLLTEMPEMTEMTDMTEGAVAVLIV